MDCHVASLLAMTKRERSLRTIPAVIAIRPTVIASRRRSNPSFVLHRLKYGLPRRYAPRNDKSEWSLRAIPTVIASRPTVIASRRRSNPSFVLHRLKYGLPRRDAPRNDKSEWSLRATPRHCEPPHRHCEPKAKQSILSPAPPEIWIASSRRSSQ